MSGFVGVAGRVSNAHQTGCERGAARMRHHPWYQSQVFQDAQLILHQIRDGNGHEKAGAETAAAGEFPGAGRPRRVERGVPGEAPESPAQGIRVWIDGDVYYENLDAAGARRELGRRLAQGLKENKLHEVLVDVDGEYAAVIQDVTQKKLHLITDRFGFAPLYYRAGGKQFFFASELKAFPDLESGSLTPDAEAMMCFLERGYLLWDETWFKEVKLLPPASHLTVNYDNGLAVSRETYWGWDQIPSLSLSFKEAVDGFADYWQRAINSRITAEPMSVFLSGGLDSRLIAATTPVDRLAGGITFGERPCLDISIAAEVCLTKDIPHHVFELTPENAFRRRAEAVWRCDAMASLGDLHASQFLTGMREVAPCGLNGFVGGALAGGHFMHHEGVQNQRPSRALTRKLFGEYGEKIPVDNNYFETPHGDVLLLATCSRRKNGVGVREGALTVRQIKPFIAKDFVEFLYGLPDAYRYGKKLYKAACLKHYAQYFAHIPYQLTGQSITAERNRMAEFRRKLSRIPVKLGLRRDNTQFLDYAAAVKAAPETGEWRNLLSPENSLLRQVLASQPSPSGQAPASEAWRNLCKIPDGGVDPGCRERFFRTATLELWLRGVDGAISQATVPC